jgi:hypothetical protein
MKNYLIKLIIIKNIITEKLIFMNYEIVFLQNKYSSKITYSNFFKILMNKELNTITPTLFFEKVGVSKHR